MARANKLVPGLLQIPTLIPLIVLIGFWKDIFGVTGRFYPAKNTHLTLARITLGGGRGPTKYSSYRVQSLKPN